MAFSGALTLTDLNDFITPSQACIKPVEEVKPVQKAREPGAASTEIRIDANGEYYEVGDDAQYASGKEMKKLEQAQISLNDCLACSGCITSAESVLITLQSHTEVLNFLDANPSPTDAGYKMPVISIAPQCLASLAASISASGPMPVTPSQILARVTAFCTEVLGFARVYDTTFARHVALLEHAREFAERKAGRKDGTGGAMPMLASACPGWICYAEKAHAEMLPFIATTKSPQQVMGTLVKSWLGTKWGKTPDQIYHVSVMPCYDKKLEASRKDFYDEVYATRDVDCVITTGELARLMDEKGWDLSSSSHASYTAKANSDLPALLAHPGTSSGSYLHSLIDTLTRTSHEPLTLTVRTIRNADYEEYTLSSPSEVVFRGAKCYGFRNLQNVVRRVGREAGVQVGRGAAGRIATTRGGGLRARMRRGKGDDGKVEEKEKGYDYVEVMACPGGCVNGGGQLKPAVISAVPTVDAEGYTRDWSANGVGAIDVNNTATFDLTAKVDGFGSREPGDAKWGDKEWTKEVEKAYWQDTSTPPASSPLHADALALRVLTDLCAPRSEHAVIGGYVNGAVNGHGKATINGDATSYGNGYANANGHTPKDATWSATMDDAAEARRRELFRTSYRAVESEVVGLAVKW
ncbi:hypothetical protein PLICRDRAFT_172952 [Plicaturopsis crispa FD-325 SS-3]|nr:hypothetical protein PLICRDRAFT_172952 [Plicaturopsis crispa FD-325 SS-3]